ncbi:hypothetical protein LOZ57_001590 [Ophidiomyces ophidiicola]|uniref:uncharacterized protein n=1 Tax=Ophidiomyces ophidiicola TaxID=1387563 RepID=UPI0020C553EA|nr:uncharacterized protein LOZ57_001590 [Ophidiomyces ophidiicola]KAI1951040.1 hypothetical protein LOZ57_001590 [Ophidiomyces ophidiicola]KAI2060981.1 hypothetical protein LOZ43_001438 [Ophidiomyces ophidiicola]KAI2087578.1 hypothetical protein LOZ36_002717 [Ophidiomyces ophidiicola]
MPHYIQLLKSPQILKHNGSSFLINTLITITTDLGDSFLAEDAKIVATVECSRSITPLQQTVTWKAGSRQLKVLFGPIRQSTDKLRMRFSPYGISSAESDSLQGPHLPKIISAWSPWFHTAYGKPVEKLVLRRFTPIIGPELCIWEETGNSIARHIWDAALAAIIDFGRRIQNRKDKNHRVTALELGSGCGIVGIALAQMLPNCSVMLTDLEEVREIINRNILTAKLADSSQVEFQTLDWDEELSTDMQNRHNDLIFLSDCTYNSDSLPALVKTIVSLHRISPTATLIVAWKKRCESESAFFRLMQDTGFAISGESIISPQSLGSKGDYPSLTPVMVYRFSRAQEPSQAPGVMLDF